MGLAPLYVYTEPDGLRKLFPIGIATSDHLGVLVAPGFEREVARGTLAFVRELAGSWDRFEFPQIDGASPLLEAAREATGSRIVLSEPCFVRPAGASMSRSMRSNLRYYQARAKRRGEVRVVRADANSWRPLWSELVRLHAARWSARSEPGVLADPGVLAAHEETIPRLLAQGVLRLNGLEIGGLLAAVYYGFQRTGTHYYYLGGFDPELADCSPGTLLIADVAAGPDRVDFLRGGEGYKLRWGAEPHPTWKLEAGP